MRDRDRVVARNGVLLVRLIVRLVHDQEFDARQRREDRASSADDHVNLPASAGLPRIVAFAIREGRVEHRDAPPEGPFEALRRLRRKRDLRNENDRAPSARQDAPDGLHVDVRLSAACHAVQQRRCEATRVERPRDPVHRRTLLAGRRGNGGRARLVVACGGRTHEPLDQSAFAHGARNHAVAEAGQQRLRTRNAGVLAHECDERGRLRPCDAAICRLEHANAKLARARIHNLAPADERTAPNERAGVPQQRAPIGAAACLGMTQQAFQCEAVGQVFPDDAQQPLRHGRVA